MRTRAALTVALACSACGDGTGPAERPLPIGTYYLHARHDDTAPEQPDLAAIYLGRIEVTSSTPERIGGAYYVRMQGSPRIGINYGADYAGLLSPGDRVGPAYRVTIGGAFRLELRLSAADGGEFSCTGTASLEGDGATRVPLQLTACELRTEPFPP